MLTIFAGLLSAHLWTERAVFAQKLVFPYKKNDIGEKFVVWLKIYM